jgi:hypothetical protein
MKKAQDSSYKMVGLVKGWIEVLNKDDDDQAQLKLLEDKKKSLE